MLKIKENKEESIKGTLLEKPGIINSFSNNLIPSANGWNKPRNPIKFGPLLFCELPIIFLSMRVIKQVIKSKQIKEISTFLKKRKPNK